MIIRNRHEIAPRPKSDDAIGLHRARINGVRDLYLRKVIGIAEKTVNDQARKPRDN
jgi:hypothetical protein